MEVSEGPPKERREMCRVLGTMGGNALWRAGIRNLEHAASVDYRQLLGIRGFGVIALARLRQWAEQHQTENEE